MGYSKEGLVKQMQKALDKAINWGEANGLSFSATKTVAMCFSRKSKFDLPERHLTINGREIEYSSETRYLGVYLDSRMNWTYHFNKKVSNAKRLLFQAKNALGMTWGPKPYLIHWIL